MDTHRIKEGDKALILNDRGRSRVVEGPRRVNIIVAYHA